MPILSSNYKVNGWKRNGHLQTIYPTFFRKVDFKYTERIRFALSDGDFIDLDWSKNENDKLIVLCHGLEGSAQSKYILGMSKFFSEHGYDVLAFNYRGCSGEVNKKLRFYHQGATDDLHEVFNTLSEYKNVHAVGFSLGGNLVLKYAGEPKFEKPKNLRSVIAFSTPVDLTDCVNEIHKPKNKIYVSNFLITLKKKVRLKAPVMNGELSTSPLKKIKTLIDFDEHYTAPLHGFKDASDYYKKSSSGQFIKGIEIPSLLINAKNDPFLGELCYPHGLAKDSDRFHFIETEHGGHCGFIPVKGENYWSEDVTFDFVKKWEK